MYQRIRSTSCNPTIGGRSPDSSSTQNLSGSRQPLLLCKPGLIPTLSSYFPFGDSERRAASCKCVVFPILTKMVPLTLVSRYHLLLGV